MPLSYVIGINLTVVGDGKSQYIAFDLLKDYGNIGGVGYRGGWLKGKLPKSAAPVSGGGAIYDVALEQNGSVLCISFPSPPPVSMQIPVNVNLFFEGEDRPEPVVKETHPQVFATGMSTE